MDIKKFSYVDMVLIIVSLIWGINTPAVKSGYKYMPPLVFNTVKLIFALIFIWSIVWITKSHRKVDRKDMLKITKICIIGYGSFQYFFTIGVNATSAGNAAVILGLLPISVVIINKVFNIEEMTIQNVIGILFSFVGVALIVIGSGKNIGISSKDVLGVIIVIAAQLSFAYYMVFCKEIVQKYSANQITAYAVTVSALIFSITCFKDVMAVNWSQVPPTAWGLVIFSGVFGMCLANIMWSWGVKKVGSTRTAVYNNLPPVFSLIISFFFLGESFGIMQLLGTLVIFVGLYITKLKKKVDMGTIN